MAERNLGQVQVVRAIYVQDVDPEVIPEAEIVWAEDVGGVRSCRAY